MYGERDDPYTAIATLGRTLAASLQLDTVLPTIVETIGQTLALQYVGLALAEGASREAAIVAEYGTPGADFLTFPLVHQGIALGELRLAARARRAPAGARPPPDRRPRTPGRRRRPRGRSLPGAAAGATAHRPASRGGATAHPSRPARRPRTRTGRAHVHARGRPQPHRLGSPARRRAARLGHRAGADDDRRRPPADLRPSPAGARPTRAGSLAPRSGNAGVLAGNVRHDRRSDLDAPAPRRRRGRRLLDRPGGTHERQAARTRPDTAAFALPSNRPR